MNRGNVWLKTSGNYINHLNILIMKILKILLLSIALFFSTSCVTVRAQQDYYPVVYYDYVINGVVTEVGFVNDGFRSYHLITEIPPNKYWVLWPGSENVFIYNKQRTYKQPFIPRRRWVFYNKSKQREYILPNNQKTKRRAIPSGHHPYRHLRYRHKPVIL